MCSMKQFKINSLTSKENQKKCLGNSTTRMNEHLLRSRKKPFLLENQTKYKKVEKYRTYV